MSRENRAAHATGLDTGAQVTASPSGRGPKGRGGAAGGEGRAGRCARGRRRGQGRRARQGQALLSLASPTALATGPGCRANQHPNPGHPHTRRFHRTGEQGTSPKTSSYGGGASLRGLPSGNKPPFFLAHSEMRRKIKTEERQKAKLSREPRGQAPRSGPRRGDETCRWRSGREQARRAVTKAGV